VVLWEWLTSPEMVALSTTEVVKDFEWLVKHLTDEEDEPQWFFIVPDGRVPVGFVAVLDGEVTLYITRAERGKGYGETALRSLRGVMGSEVPLRARVRDENEPSIKVFEKAGYTQVSSLEGVRYLVQKPNH
jgi:RimJ/RimL family protein N-acetyltransferase